MSKDNTNELKYFVIPSNKSILDLNSKIDKLEEQIKTLEFKLFKLECQNIENDEKFKTFIIENDEKFEMLKDWISHLSF